MMNACSVNSVVVPNDNNNPTLTLEETKIEPTKEETKTPHLHEFNIMKYNDNVHWQECVCGHKTDEEAHKGGTATETVKAVCDVCKVSYGDFAEVSHQHSYELKMDDNYHWQECNCSDVKDKEKHYGGIATTTAKAKCNYCKKEFYKQKGSGKFCCSECASAYKIAAHYKEYLEDNSIA